MTHPKLAEYSDDGCRYVEWHWLRKHRFDNRDDLIEAAYPDAEPEVWLNSLDSSQHKAALETYLTNIIRNDLITLDQVRQNLRIIADDANSDPFTQVTDMVSDFVGGFFDHGAVVEAESAPVGEAKATQSGIAPFESKPSKPLNPTLIKRKQERIAAERWSRDQYGEGFIENKAFISKAKSMVTDMVAAGSSRDDVIEATDQLIATYERDYGLEPLTQAQKDNLCENVVLKRYDRLYKSDMIEQALLDGTTGATRADEVKAFVLWHQIKRVSEVGETFEMGQRRALRWIGGDPKKVKAAADLLVDLEAIKEQGGGEKWKVQNPNTPSKAATYKRLL